MRNVSNGIVIIIAALGFVQPVFALTPPESAVYSEKVASQMFTTAVSSKLATSSLLKDELKENIFSHDYVEGEVLVKYKINKINLNTSSGRTSSSKFADSNSLEKKEDFKKSNISLLRITDSETVEQKIAKLENDPSVEYSQPNFKYYPTTIAEDDTYKDQLWGLDNLGQTVGGSYSISNPGTVDKDIDAPEAWLINEGTNSSVIVAVIDSGVAYNHPDLLPNMWNGVNCVSDINTALGGCNHGYDFEDSDKIPLPTNDSHGTHIAGTIAAVKNNDKGVIGVAPQAKIMALKSSLTTVNIIKSINFAKYNGAEVINASWGGSNNDQLLKDAIASFPGLFVAAAGNDALNNENDHLYPSDFNLDNIISVAATDQKDVLATFSNYGATSVDVGAPGTNIYSTISSETVIVSETFESVAPPAVPSLWVKDGVSNNWGVLDAAGWLGENWGHVLYNDIDTPYANNANTTITSPAYNLSTGGANIDFWAICDTEYGSALNDYMTVQISADGSNFSGLNLGGLWGTTNGEFNEWYLDSDVDSSGSAVYHFENISIPSQYLTSNFKFRFRWVSNASDNGYEGCLLDDIRVTKLSDGSDEQYAYANGTSMAAPHVAGLAALIEGYNPNLTAAQVKNAILTSGDDVASLSGKTVSGKRINARQALLAVNPAKAITSFNVPSQIGATIINDVAHTIELTVPSGTDISALTPTVVITGVSVSPQSGAAVNFTSPVTYTVTAADSSIQTYSVTVSVAPAPDTTAPVITLIDANPLNIYVGSTFSDPGATALDDVDGIVPVTTSGTVDTATVDTYTITYTATDAALNTASITRTVNVIVPPPLDTVAPAITLLGSSPVNLTVGDTFIDGGATALDDIDGDITAQIIVINPVNTSVAGIYTITYNVSDEAGNLATEVTRTVNVEAVIDTTAPIIELAGDNPVNLTVGDAYIEPGYTALDTIDGNITDSVVIGGDTVDTATPHTYTITYNVSDSAQNPALEVTRVVNVSDVDAPVFSGVPANYNLEATSASGAELIYTLPTATDDVDGDVLVTCTLESNTMLSFGPHTIECSASDSVGNVATASFIVTVVDITAPAISNMPSNQIIAITSGVSVSASYLLPTASDVVDGSVSVVCTPESNSTFPLGTTTVECSAEDAASNETVESFTINVTTTATPSTGNGGGSSSGGGGGGGSTSKATTPNYSVQINKGASQTTSPQVVLAISPVSGAKQMQISNTSSFASSTWIAFKTTYPWTLTQDPGTKTVYVRYGKNGKVIGSAKDSISLTLKVVPTQAQPSPVAPPSKVLGIGISTYNFVNTLLQGSTGQDVIELQKVLITEGHLKISQPTGFYGLMTGAAVKAYQAVHGIKQTGVVERSTLDVLNKTVSPVMSNEQRLLLIKELQAKLLDLQEKFKALTASKSN